MKSALIHSSRNILVYLCRPYTQWSVRHDLGRKDVLEISRCTVLDRASEVTAFTSQTNLQRNIVRIKRVVSIKMLIALKRLNDVLL